MPRGPVATRMFVSIIITNHNYADYLPQAIESALQQSWRRKEVIVVDDGSTDHSRDIISSYGESINSVVTANHGHCSAANVGFAISRGDVVIFLDADDCLAEGAIEALVDPIARDSSVSKSQGYLMAVDEQGIATGRMIPLKLPPSGDYRKSTLQHGPDGCRHTFTSGNAWAAWFLREVMPLPETRRLGVDSCLNAVSTLFGRTASVKRTVAAYRLHDRNQGPIRTRFTRSSLRRRLRQIEATQAHLEQWAHRLGHRVSPTRWSRGNWRYHLLSHALAVMEHRSPPVSFRELVTAPFYASRAKSPKTMRIAAMLCLVQALPRNYALGVSRRLLKLPKLEPVTGTTSGVETSCGMGSDPS